MTERPSVTCIVPVFNEAERIVPCLAAIVAQAHPAECTEIIVVDGSSTDGSGEIVRSWLSRHAPAHHWKVVDNPVRWRPVSLNLGLTHASGDVICRVDARSRIAPNYVARCVELLSERADIAVVGGAQVATVDEHARLMRRAAVRALRNPLTMGFARYRRGRSSGPTDTVYLGAFRRVDLERVGGWNDRLDINEDYELAQRLRRLGLVWFDEQLRSRYEPRTSIVELHRQYRSFGRGKAAAWLEQGLGLTPRHLAILAIPPAATAAVAAFGRRHPLVTAATTGAALVAIGGYGEPAPISERMVGSVIASVIVGSWTLGVFEQVGRHVAGERLLPSGDA